MKAIQLLVMLGLLSFNSSMYAQFIRAGMVGADDLYHDIIPDTSLCCSAFNPNFPSYRKYFDLDHDGTYDLAIHVWGGGSLSGGSTHCEVDKLAAQTSIIATYISSYGYTVPVADTLNLGDSISPADTFIHDNCYIWSSNWGGAVGTGPEVSQWSGEHYIGVRLAQPRETLYGWIRVTVAGDCITIMDYACNKGVYTGIPGPLVSESPVVFPNPAGSTVRLNWNGSRGQERELSVYSFSGILMYQAHCSSGQATTTLDVASWPKGVYLIKTMSGNQISTRRLEIIH